MCLLLFAPLFLTSLFSYAPLMSYDWQRTRKVFEFDIQSKHLPAFAAVAGTALVSYGIYKAWQAWTEKTFTELDDDASLFLDTNIKLFWPNNVYLSLEDLIAYAQRVDLYPYGSPTHERIGLGVVPIHRAEYFVVTKQEQARDLRKQLVNRGGSEIKIQTLSIMISNFEWYIDALRAHTAYAVEARFLEQMRMHDHALEIQAMQWHENHRFLDRQEKIWRESRQE